MANAIWALWHEAVGQISNKKIEPFLENYNEDFLLHADAGDLKEAAPFLTPEKIAKYIHLRNSDRPLIIEEILAKQDIQLISITEATYPALLQEIYDPPWLLYVKGHLTQQHLGIGMVGSRKCTAYGRQVAYDFARELSAEGVQVISGLALGIDGAAHQGALCHPAGTVAVLGCGVDRIYPHQHKDLYHEILNHANSAIISEFPLASDPKSWHFPKRNRMIAGLSQGLVVVEATLKSGALITAKLALEEGREVFAVPGMITSAASRGSLKLIQDGAKMILCTEDILSEFGEEALFQHELWQDTPKLSDKEAIIFDCISAVPVAVEEIIRKTGLAPAEVLMLLSTLELQGLVETIVGRRYIRCNRY